MASSPTHPRKGGADWLGLKEDDWDLHPPSATREPHRGGSAFSTPSAPHLVGRHSAPAGLPSSSGAKPAPKDVDALAKASQASQLGAPEGEEEEDWLSHALSRKKSQGPSREEHAAPSKGQNAVGVVSQPPSSRYRLGLLSLAQGEPGRAQGAPAVCPRAEHGPYLCPPLEPHGGASGSLLCPGADTRGWGCS